jgi:hypothetical protein
MFTLLQSGVDGGADLILLMRFHTLQSILSVLENEDSEINERCVSAVALKKSVKITKSVPPHSVLLFPVCSSSWLAIPHTVGSLPRNQTTTTTTRQITLRAKITRREKTSESSRGKNSRASGCTSITTPLL